METRKAYGSPAPSNGQSPSSGSQSPVVLPGAASPSNSSPSTPQAPPPGPTQSAPPPPPSIPHPVAQTAAAHVPLTQAPPQTQEPPAPMPSTAQPAAPAQKRGFMSRLFGSSAAETSPDKSGPFIFIHRKHGINKCGTKVVFLFLQLELLKIFS